MSKLILEYERKIIDLDNILRHEKEMFAKNRSDMGIRFCDIDTVFRWEGARSRNCGDWCALRENGGRDRKREIIGNCNIKFN